MMETIDNIPVNRKLLLLNRF